MNETTAKVTIIFHGDPSVGIFPYSFEMTIPRIAIEDDRELSREQIKELYFQLEGEYRPEVIFDDENE